jgi:hypothetical protein
MFDFVGVLHDNGDLFVVNHKSGQLTLGVLYPKKYKHGIYKILISKGVE